MRSFSVYRYHRSCYNAFTKKYRRELDSRPKKSPSVSIEDPFEVFCSRKIDGDLREGKLITLKTLKRRFRKTVIKIQGKDLSNTYKTVYLKNRLQSRYPDIRFVKQKNPSLSDIAFFETSSRGQVITADFF